MIGSTTTGLRKPRASASSISKRRSARRPNRTGFIAIGAVIVVLGAMLVIKLVPGQSSKATPEQHLPLKLEYAVTHIPLSIADSVVSANPVTPRAVKDGIPTLLAGDKPTVLYVGAEYCPFCAAERWPLVVALSRFGAFSGLGETESSSIDVDPNTPTLSLFGAIYRSKYLNLEAVELTTNKPVGPSYQRLQYLTKKQTKIMQTFDVPPYSSARGTIPFIDIGNRYIQSGASYSPEVLQGLDQEAVIANLRKPSSSIAQSIDGSANVLSAALCSVTKDQPTQVCSSPAVRQYVSKLSS